MQNDTDEDKRDFFRIQDKLGLEYCPITGPDELEHVGLKEQSPLYQLLSDLHLLDHESQHLLRQIGEKDRTLANYLKIINKRIDLIGKVVALQSTEESWDTVEVTLSEGGMSFPATKKVELGSWLGMRITLLPALLGLTIPARVLRCDADTAAPGCWIIGVGFEALTDPQRQLLARHILQKQAQEIRAAKTSERIPT
ncbi:MAG TPA: PilZ domain-containing protein [Pseudomonas xinjiangensis]|uniref:PilZ domain-containing protein n=2 Tax=root TaxID=1 RepID=A0A7V1BQH0_9GAMM|nr:PilZ domain-containing protein [Halopseudomonas xinjiangensis]HEC46763.1 PilZ domain-containing protein [Halopseudomonas xinjiangensis]